MKKLGALLGLFFLIMLAWGGGHPTLAQSPPTTAAPVTINLPGTLTDAQGKPAANAKITVTYHNKSYEDTSGESGEFDIANIDISSRFLIDLTGKLTDSNGKPLAGTMVQFHLYDNNYKAITDATGAFVIKNINLARSLSGWYIPFFLLIPGIFGLVWAGLKDWIWPEKEGDAKIAATGLKENQFWMALLNSFVWILTLLILALLGVRKLHFFSSQLEFDFYVPILGFLGALLYMFHMFQKGEEKVPKGKEFGMRVLLAPYVAIIMVVLFGRDLGLVNLDSTAGKGTLAFFSGLLVITALQKIIENGQEKLGRWREASRYEASEIAKEFKLSLEEDLKLRKGDIAYLVQLEQYSEDQLREKARKIGFDEYLLVGLKRKYPKIILRKEIGSLVWGKLKKLGVREIEDFAQLSDQALQDLNKGDAEPKIDTTILKNLRDRAREICLTSSKSAGSKTAANQPPQESTVIGDQAD